MILLIIITYIFLDDQYIFTQTKSCFIQKYFLSYEQGQGARINMH